MTRVRVLYAVACGAGPASEIGTLVELAQADDWDVQVIATPAGRDFLDVPALEALTGHPVRSAYRDPSQRRHQAPPVDATVVAPATYNTINKLANGIADNYALGVLAECIGIGVPLVILPFINSALAARKPLIAAVASLRSEGIQVLLGPDGFEPHPPGQGSDRIASFPWGRALIETSAVAPRPS